MFESRSFLAPQIGEYIEYQIKCDRWHETSHFVLRRFDTFLFINYSDADSLTQEMVSRWAARHSTESIKTWVCRCYSIKKFFEFLSMRGYSDVRIEIDADVKLPDPPKPPHIFTKDELKAFFHACDNIGAGKRETSQTRRYRLIISTVFRLLYSTGMRPCEVLRLKMNDVDLNEGVLSIAVSKNGHQRFIALHQSMTELLKVYDAAMQKLLPRREYFFPSQNGGKLYIGFIGANFSLIWGTISQQEARAYDLRHNLAIENINGWMELDFEFHDRLLYLSRYMGHTKISSTAYYYSISQAFADRMEDLDMDLDSMIPEVIHEECQ